jgi:hypothetical protein
MREPPAQERPALRTNWRDCGSPPNPPRYLGGDKFNIR